MTRQEAHEEIAYINRLPLAEVLLQYNVDTRLEAIALIEDQIEDEEPEAASDIYQENGFLSEYHCNAYLY